MQALVPRPLVGLGSLSALPWAQLPNGFLRHPSCWQVLRQGRLFLPC